MVIVVCIFSCQMSLTKLQQMKRGKNRVPVPLWTCLEVQMWMCDFDMPELVQYIKEKHDGMFLLTLTEDYLETLGQKDPELRMRFIRNLACLKSLPSTTETLKSHAAWKNKDRFARQELAKRHENELMAELVHIVDTPKYTDASERKRKRINSEAHTRELIWQLTVNNRDQQKLWLEQEEIRHQLVREEKIQNKLAVIMSPTIAVKEGFVDALKALRQSDDCLSTSNSSSPQSSVRFSLDLTDDEEELLSPLSSSSQDEFSFTQHSNQPMNSGLVEEDTQEDAPEEDLFF